MQRVNCVVAIGGDIGNRVSKVGITVAEVALLQATNGEGSVTEVHVVEPSHASHRDVYNALKAEYPKYAAAIERIWMDRGGKMPDTVKDLGLTREMMARDAIVHSDPPALSGTVMAASKRAKSITSPHDEDESI